MRKLRKDKDKSFIVKTSKHTPKGFTLIVRYLEGVGHKNKYFSCIWKDCVEVLVKNWNEILTDFVDFERDMLMLMTEKVKDHFHYTLHTEKPVFFWLEKAL